MEIPHHTQQAITKQNASNLFKRYDSLKIDYRIQPETYFEGHYDQETGYDLHTSVSIEINGLENPMDASTHQPITIEKKTRGTDTRYVKVTCRGHEMFTVHKSGVEPPECTELAGFIISKLDKVI